jgi:EAL and modified HD-GYP domain-containing signal transduction protein
MSQSGPSPLQDVFVGRQPIYGRHLELYAYELLYRGADEDVADFTEGDQATSQVLLNTFTEFGLDRVVGDHLAFVNLTRGFVIGEYPLPLPRSRVVLEVLEDVEADPEVLAGLQELRERGFKIALDDFVLREETQELIPLADILKIDVVGLDAEMIRRRHALLEPHGCKLLAEKVETREQFEVCLDAGFHFFQGFFLAKPNVVKGKSISASRLNLLRLLAELQDPAVDFERIEEIVSQDVTMSYKLLRHINSARYGMPRTIESVRETVVYLGLSQVRSLASLFLLATVDDKPHELITTAMMRAKMCELVARAADASDVQPFFTAGLFSTLDAMLDAPMSAILARLPLTEGLRAAILEGEGDVGEVLTATLAYERGRWGEVACLGLERGTIRDAFLGAVRWVEEVDQEISGSAI